MRITREWLQQSYCFDRGAKSAQIATAINGTTRPFLYQTQRYGLTSLSFALPSPGSYILRLRLAETHFNSSAKRVFDVSAQNVTL